MSDTRSLLDKVVEYTFNVPKLTKSINYLFFLLCLCICDLRHYTSRSIKAKYLLSLISNLNMTLTYIAAVITYSYYLYS
jgi:hypothetical protein